MAWKNVMLRLEAVVVEDEHEVFAAMIALGEGAGSRLATNSRAASAMEHPHALAMDDACPALDTRRSVGITFHRK